ncbi:MAG: hypothetical protein ACE5JB_07665 [bacterium]
MILWCSKKIFLIYILIQKVLIFTSLLLPVYLKAEAKRPATEHPNPWPLATVRPSHPRLWFNQENLALLRVRWNDPAHKNIVDNYKNSNDALSSALRYLATGNVSDAQAAISEALSYGNSADHGEREAAWGDVPSLVFDWCYDQLSSSQKSSLISKIQGRQASLVKNTLDYFRWHEIHLRGVHAYISAVLAIEGEPGVSSQLREAQNVLQNLQELGDEVSGDGAYRPYFYQGSYQPLSFFLWTTATDLDVVSRSGFTRHLPDFIVRRLSQSGSRFTRGEGDDDGDESGYFVKTNLAAGTFYMIASHFNDPLAQWLGNTLRDHDQPYHWPSSREPIWLSLIYYDPSIPSNSPGSTNQPLVKYFDKDGMVHFRSGWNFDPTATDDIMAWFYNGPKPTHSENSQNHFTIWRGDDDLAITGGNYFGSPSKYDDHYFGHAIARNTLIFSPKGSSAPDKDGGQVNGKWLQPISSEKYPIADELVWYQGETSYRGEITYFINQPDYAITTGDASIAYDHNHVYTPDGSRYFIRDFIYLKPDIFLIRDRFALSDVDNIRWILHSRTKPIYTGTSTVIRGSSNAGILEATGNKFAVEKGDSRLEVNLLWPSQATLRFVGGEGYEAWVDGSNSDPSTDAQGWLLDHPYLPIRMGLSKNQWRTEIETTPTKANGNIITALFVSGIQSNLEKPVFLLRENGNDKVIAVNYKSKIIEVVYPHNSVPVVQGAERDTIPPNAPQNIRIKSN